ncbi:MAG: UbiD family decarboxylase domain-containing protein [Infirmifilum sp.]
MGLREVIGFLKTGQLLLDIDEKISSDYDAPWLTLKLASKTPKALLFWQVEGKQFPLATNIYYNKVERVFQASPNTLLSNFNKLSSFLREISPSPSSKIGVLASLAWLSDVHPKLIEGSVFMSHSGLEVDLTILPAIRHSRDEEHPVIKNPSILLSDPNSKENILFSEPIQIIDEKTIQLHLPRNSRASTFIEDSARRGESINVAVMIGVSPYLQLVTKMDWLPWFDKYLLTGALAGKPMNLTKIDGLLYVPIDAEIILLGEIVPGDVRPEGKMLYEDMKLYGGSPMPLARVKKILYKPSSVFYTSITHPVYSDDYALNKLREKFLLEYVKNLAPDITDLSFLSYDAYRTLLVTLNNPSRSRVITVGSLLFSLDINPYLDTIIVLKGGERLDNVENLVPIILSSMQPDKIIYFESSPEEDSLRPERKGKVIIDATSVHIGYLDKESEFRAIAPEKLQNIYEKLMREALGE